MQALRRFVRSRGEIGAALWCDVSEPERPGRAFRTVITDGESFEVIDWSDPEAPKADLLAGPIETAVERRVCALGPPEARIPMLRAFRHWFAESGIPLRLGERAVQRPQPGEEEEESQAA